MVIAAYSARYSMLVLSMVALVWRSQSHALAVNTIPNSASGRLYLHVTQRVGGRWAHVPSLLPAKRGSLGFVSQGEWNVGGGAHSTQSTSTSARRK
jgi:hypothetical protein